MAAMKEEIQGSKENAYKIYLQAWEESSDDYDRCISAHYIARYQKTLEDVLKWNTISLEHAKLVTDEKIKSFFPSLYLNMGKSYEDLGEFEKAKHYYDLSKGNFDVLNDDTYGDSVRDAIERANRRIDPL